MSTEQKVNFGQRVLLHLAGIGVWLPIVSVALLAFLISGDKSMGSAMLLAYSVIFLAQVEIGGILLLLIYAARVRPWRLSGTARDTFLIHVSAASLVVLMSSVFFLSTLK